jgi:hypothetical protein
MQSSLIRVGPVKNAIFAVYKALAKVYKALVRCSIPGADEREG